MVGFEVTDDGFDRLAPFELLALLLIQRFMLAAVNHLDRRHLDVHATVAEVDDRRMRPGRSGQVLQQDVCLLELGV